MNGDVPAERVRQFEERVLPHVAHLYRAALRLVGSVADAEDMVQETCLRAFRALDQVARPEATRAWVFTVLRSVFLQHVSRRSAGPGGLGGVDDAVGGTILARWDEAADASPLRHAILEEVRSATLRLPLPYREAIVLAHVAGFSYREMATILDLPIGTVMSRLFRARRLLRKALEQSGASSRRSERA